MSVVGSTQRVVALLAMAALLLVGLVVVQPSAASAVTSAEFDLLDRINTSRAAAGVAPVKLSRDANDLVSRPWSARMAAENRLYHNPAYASQISSRVTSSWTRLSENVGYASSVASVYNAFMNSSGHRANILDSKVNWVGLGVVVKNGRVWATMNFIATTRSLAEDVPPPTVTVERLAGDDRYATASSLSESTFAPGVPVAYIATGRNFPDGLAAGPIAARAGGPVLPVDVNSIPPAVAAELQRLRPQRIVVVGSTGVVSAAVEAALAAYTSGPVQRVAGANRYSTAAALSEAFAPGVGIVYVATGSNFPDALAGGPLAARNGSPMLLVSTKSIPDATAAALQRLRPGRIVILGSTGVVSSGVETLLRSYTSGTVSRLAGSDRYATAAVIAKQFGSSATVMLSTGLNFPDALSAVPIADRENAPMLLTSGTCVTSATENARASLGAGAVTAVGSTGVVSDTAARFYRC